MLAVDQYEQQTVEVSLPGVMDTTLITIQCTDMGIHTQYITQQTQYAIGHTRENSRRDRLGFNKGMGNSCIAQLNSFPSLPTTRLLLFAAQINQRPTETAKG